MHKIACALSKAGKSKGRPRVWAFDGESLHAKVESEEIEFESKGKFQKPHAEHFAVTRSIDVRSDVCARYFPSGIADQDCE